MPINFTLANGRRVDLETEEGANYFILHGSPDSFGFFSSNLERVDKIYADVRRRRSKRPTGQEREALTVFYATVNALAWNADDDAFAKIPASEIERYVDHTLERFGDLATAERWARTETLGGMHEKLKMKGWTGLCRHATVCKLVFDKELFGPLAEMAAAPRTVTADDAETISMIVANAIVSVVFDEKKLLPSPERAFKKLESCGMLAQLIRLSVSPPMSSNPAVLKLYDELIKCQKFIKEKFAKDQPCGRMLVETLNNCPRHHAVLPKLRTIMAFTDLLKGSPEVPQSLEGGFRICRHCNKNEHTLEFQQSLRKCARCKTVFYCSKDCQVADWKSHKRNCEPVSSSQAKKAACTDASVDSFVLRNVAPILKELARVSEATGKSKGELLIEIDFATPPGHGGMAPALRNEFKIAEAKGYYEGSRPNEPDWFCKNEDMDVYRRNIKAAIKALRDTHDRLTDDHLLCFVRSPAGPPAVYRLTYLSPIGKQMFSEEAVSAAQKAIREGDFGPLSTIFGEDTPAMRILRKEFGGPPSESDMDRVRMMLNQMGADFPLSGNT